MPEEICAKCGHRLPDDFAERPSTRIGYLCDRCDLEYLYQTAYEQVGYFGEEVDPNRPTMQEVTPEMANELLQGGDNRLVNNETIEQYMEDFKGSIESNCPEQPYEECGPYTDSDDGLPW